MPHFQPASAAVLLAYVAALAVGPAPAAGSLTTTWINSNPGQFWQTMPSPSLGANGCNFNMSRVPIGSSDFTLGYYSLDDTVGDYSLANFSIARDQQNLIPYIKAAEQVRPDLKVWGCPWSPHAWLKTNANYAGGSINFTPQTLTTHANYLVDWAEAYKAQGIDVMAITPQNEPTVNSDYPSCTWNADQIRQFIDAYLGPTLQSRDPTPASNSGSVPSTVLTAVAGLSAPQCSPIPLPVATSPP